MNNFDPYTGEPVSLTSAKPHPIIQYIELYGKTGDKTCAKEINNLYRVLSKIFIRRYDPAIALNTNFYNMYYMLDKHPELNKVWKSMKPLSDSFKELKELYEAMTLTRN